MHEKKIYFLGIGGIGVSAIAKYYHSHGFQIYGSDLSSSYITDDLIKNYQAKIHIGNDPRKISQKMDLLIYSPAIKKEDKELQKALSLSIPCFSYPEALGEISKEKYTIAISGTNGKTTTSSMLLEAMKDQGVHPSIIVGGILQKYNTNFLSGDSPYFIVEACEYKRSFLQIKHNIVVITNITEDHLDYFQDIQDIQSAFISFIKNKKDEGILVANSEMQNIKNIIKEAKKNKIKLYDYSSYLDKKYTLSLPGEHNRQNMAAALATIKALNLDVEKAYAYLSQNFLGAKRRMEYIGETKYGALIYDDYAHNPEGIRFLLNGLKKKYPEKKIVIIFEPHLYSRTEDFKEGFGESLSLADIIYLFPVYKAREKTQPEKDFILENHIKNKENFYKIKNQNMFKEIFEKQKYNKNYIIVTVGAGDIWKQGLKIKKQ